MEMACKQALKEGRAASTKNPFTDLESDVGRRSELKTLSGELEGASLKFYTPFSISVFLLLFLISGYDGVMNPPLSAV